MKKNLFLMIAVILIVTLCAGGILKALGILPGTENKEKMGRLLLTYMQERYGVEFEQLQLTRGFNGNRGPFFRMVCRSKETPEKCVAYCYRLNKGKSGNLTMGRYHYEVTDDYCNIALQEEYAKGLRPLVGENVWVKCQLITPNYSLTDQEFQAGVRSVLESPEHQPHMYVFVIADSARTDVQQIAEEYMAGFDGYQQYLYVVYDDDPDKDLWDLWYRDHQDDFDGYIVDDSRAKQVIFNQYCRGEGFEGSKIVKQEE